MYKFVVLCAKVFNISNTNTNYIRNIEHLNIINIWLRNQIIFFALSRQVIYWGYPQGK